MNACVCGFVASPDVSPSSAAWHRQHETHHLAKYPRVDQRTREALAELIASAERHELVESVLAPAVDQRQEAIDLAAKATRGANAARRAAAIGKPLTVPVVRPGKAARS